MSILFMGTPEFAAVSLEALLSAGLKPSGVVTQPDRPKGRGMQLQISAVKQVALQHQLPVWQPEQISDPEFMAEFERIQPELVIVVAFGQKIPDAILFKPRFGCINVHGSLLPKYRGAAPIQWSILNGDNVTGVTTMYMDEGWDTGDIIYQDTTEIATAENFGSLYQRLAKLGGSLLVTTVKAVMNGRAPRLKQDDSMASRAPKIRPEHAVISWNQPAQKLYNLVRALAPAPAAETKLQQERLKIIETKIVTGYDQEQAAEPGTILKIIKGAGILVATADLPLMVTQVQPAGKRVMTAFEYANGRRLTLGMFLG